MAKIVREGKINLGGSLVSCYVLDNGTTVLEENAIKDLLVSYYEGHFPLVESQVFFKGDVAVKGHEVDLFIGVCADILINKNHNNMELTERQKSAIKRCEAIIMDFAKLGLNKAIKATSTKEQALNKMIEPKLSPFDLALKKGLNFNPKDSE